MFVVSLSLRGEREGEERIHEERRFSSVLFDSRVERIHHRSSPVIGSSSNVSLIARSLSTHKLLDDVVQVPANELPPIVSPITKKNNDQDEQATDEAVPSDYYRVIIARGTSLTRTWGFSNMSFGNRSSS
ncbi:uncharacterized protein LOC124680620 [Lolium rigidum]|uniref:uncharacterized protein LOC124680620 n=1 Tax=Lolium rigidum TaxID=89674 RepID=UPI001F5DAB53|nr:uncharacterized protein LOC124680620 [Lolium rigidum]